MELFLTIAFTHFIALLTPGVDFFLILKTVVQEHRNAARFVCIGIAIGNAVILIMIYLSMYILGKVNIGILVLIKYLGACYLLYLAFQCFQALRQQHAFSENVHYSKDSLDQKTTFKSLYLGLFSSLLNPKNILFYSTLVILVYSQFSVVENALICLWMVVIVLLWNLGIVQLLSRDTYQVWLQHHMQYLYGLSTICFIFFAVVLLIK